MVSNEMTEKRRYGHFGNAMVKRLNNGTMLATCFMCIYICISFINCNDECDDEPFEAFELAVDLPIVTDICWGFG
jgi:hypothetical protein